MTKRLFVCHANADIEATSEVVDVLENTLEFPAGTLLTSSLPGYSSDTRNEDELRAMLAETAIVLALVTETSVQDPEFNFELGATWALGLRTVALVLGEAAEVHLPWPARVLPSVRAQNPEDWATLIGDLALRLGLVARSTPVQTPALAPLAAEAADEAPETVLEELVAAAVELQEPQPAEPPIRFDAFPASEVTPVDPQDWAAAEAAIPTELAQPTAADDVDVYRTTLAAVEPFATPDELSASKLSLSLSPSEPPTSAVYARLPTCEMALEAGRSVSDCLFNRNEISDFETELASPLGKLVDAIGGSWESLRSSYDFDGWISMTDYLLKDLPENVRRVQDWYQLGFELATLHNLAGQLELTGPGRSQAGELQWRAALERFLTCAERAEIGYENLGRVLALLENLAGPRSERDLANIGRSLAELRRYAAGADGIHTAA